MKRKLLLFALSALGSALLFCVCIPRDWLLFVSCAAGVLLAIACVVYHTEKTDVTERILLAVCGMVFSLLLTIVWNETVLVPALSLDDTAAMLEMTVCEPPYVGDGFVSFEALVTKIGGEETSMRVQVTTEEDVTVQLGEMLTVFGTLRASSAQQQTYDRAQGILMRVQIRIMEHRELPPRLPFYLVPAYISQEIGSKFDAILSNDASALLSALLLGDKTKLSSDTKVDLRRTGLSHVAAVSGLHVSFLVGLLMTVFRRKLGMALSVPALLFFAVMTGASPSVLRAVIMQLVWIFSFPAKRENDAPTAMGFAAVCILCMNPYASGDISLWLSFGSALGVTLWSSRIAAFLAGTGKKRGISGRMVRYVCAAIATTLASQIFVLPISLVYFRETSTISVFSNLLLLGIVQVLFFLGVVTAVLAFLLPQLLAPVIQMSELLSGFFLTAVDWMAALPFSYAAADVYVFLAVAAIYLLTGLFLVALRHGAEKRKSLQVLACMTAMILCITVCGRTITAQHSAYLLVPNMRGGQFAALTARDACIAVNCGGYACVDLVTELLRLREVRDIDLLILTDYNATSTNGVEDLLEEIPVGAIVMPSPRTDAEKTCADAIGTAALERGASVRILSIGTELTTEQYAVGELEAAVMIAGEAASDRGRCSVYLTAGETAVFVTGNVKPETLEETIRKYGTDDADVLALSAYYGRNVLPQGFLDPDKTVITTGYDGVSSEVLTGLGERENVYLPEYAQIVMRFGL